MPCSCEGYPDTYAEDREKRIKELLTMNDVLADLLCKVGRCCINRKPFPKEVIDWWDNHAKEDAKRGEPWEETLVIAKPEYR